MTVLVCLKGLSPYGVVAELQDRLVDLRGGGEIPDVLLALTHPETITLGRMAGEDAVVDAAGVEVVPISRGGEATWHGPGQVVVYPIVRLHGVRKDVPRALRAIEQGVIDVLATWGVEAGRDPRNTGVWVGGQKIGSVGIGLRRWVVRHGLALNVDASLEGFRRIRPCGFDPGVMTRLADHVTPCPPVVSLYEPVAVSVARHLVEPVSEVWWRECQTPRDASSLVDALRALAGDRDAP